MGLDPIGGIGGEILDDIELLDNSKWTVGPNWSIPEDGFAYWVWPILILDGVFQNHTVYEDHLYMWRITVDIFELTPPEAFNLYLPNSWMPNITAVGDYIQYRKMPDPASDVIGWRIPGVGTQAGDNMKVHAPSVIDVTVTIASLYNMTPDEATKYEYWLIEDDKVMFLFANIGDATNVLIIFDPHSM